MINTKPKNLRNEMVQTSAFIDSLREAFGKESINQQILKGMNGDPVFFASENGYEIGTRIEHGTAIQWDSQGIAFEVNSGGANET